MLAVSSCPALRRHNPRCSQALTAKRDQPTLWPACNQGPGSLLWLLVVRRGCEVRCSGLHEPAFNIQSACKCSRLCRAGPGSFSRSVGYSRSTGRHQELTHRTVSTIGNTVISTATQLLTAWLIVRLRQRARCYSRSKQLRLKSTQADGHRPWITTFCARTLLGAAVEPFVRQLEQLHQLKQGLTEKLAAMEMHHRLRRDPNWHPSACNLCGQVRHGRDAVVACL